MDKVTIERAMHKDGEAFYLTHTSSDEAMRLTPEELQNLKEQLYSCSMPKDKLIIHETDCHGSGNVHYQGQTHYYAYDDETGNLKEAIKVLINIGFINEEDVILFEDNEIYTYIESKLKEEE